MHKKAIHITESNVSFSYALKKGNFTNFKDVFDRNDNLKLLQIDGELVLSYSLRNGRVIICRLFSLRNQSAENIEIKKNGPSLHIEATVPYGKYEAVIEQDTSFIFQMLKYKIYFSPFTHLLLDALPRDLLILNKETYAQASEGTTYAEQKQLRSGVAFIDFGKSISGCLFYFQNFSSLNAYADTLQVSMADTVKVDWPEIGFKLPVSSTKQLTKGERYLIKDTYIMVHPHKPKNKFEVASHYLEMQEAVYRSINLPTTKVLDYQKYAEYCLNDLHNYKGCWHQVEMHAYLNAYINDYDNPVESMVQLAVLAPLVAYRKQYPNQQLDSIIQALLQNIPNFYDPRMSAVEGGYQK